MFDSSSFARSAERSGLSRWGSAWDWALLPLSLDPAMLPYYLLRMALAMVASLMFSAVFAVLASRYRLAERVLVPLLDVLQSIPVLAGLSARCSSASSSMTSCCSAHWWRGLTNSASMKAAPIWPRDPGCSPGCGGRGC